MPIGPRAAGSDDAGPGSPPPQPAGSGGTPPYADWTVGRSRRLVRAGLTTGVVDWLFSSVLVTFFYQSTVTKLWQGVASTLIGKEAFDGGPATVLLGTLMHFGVAFGWSAVYLFLVLRADWVRALLCSRFGIFKVASFYGPAIWTIMSVVLIPSLVHRPPTIGFRWWVQWLGHIPFVAVPIVAAVGRGRTGASIAR